MGGFVESEVGAIIAGTQKLNRRVGREDDVGRNDRRRERCERERNT